MDTELDAWISASQRQALADPIEAALGLPGRAYSPGFYALEQARLFPRTWAAIGFGCDLPNPGDAVPTELAGTPLLMVRQTDGSVRAFHNVCRHRGMALATEPRQALRSLTCPWHGWSYALDGTLRHTTNIGGEGQHRCQGFATGELGLKDVRSARWNDLVLVNLDGRAAPFNEHIAPLDDLLQGIELDGLLLNAGWQHHYPGNWKLAVEGGIEDYHLPLAHPQLFDGVGKRPARIVTGACYGGTVGLPEWTTPPEVPAGFPGLKMTEAHLGHSYVLNLFPTAMVLVNGSTLLLALFTPDGPARTRLDFRQYTAPAAFGTPELDAWRAARAERLQAVVRQDDRFVEHVQRAAVSRDAAGIDTRFSPYWEGAVLHFQRQVLQAMSAPKPVRA